MRSENNRIEYKQNLTDDLEKEAVAFLNYHEGGVIYIGVHKTGTPIGVNDIDGDMLRIKDRLKNNVMPSCMGLFDVAVENIDSKDIIKITFASGTEKPYYIKKSGMSEKLWNPVALREAVINAIVHNDYTSEITPKFEFFNDRIEITSFGSLPQGITEKEFFEGYSVPRNKELMRIFRDLDLVEHLGSGVPRILRSYGKDCFKFTENFLRMVFPVSVEQVTPQVTPQVGELIKVLDNELNRQEIQEKLKLSDREHFRLSYLKPALDSEFIEMTIPDKPNSRLQKYRLTEKGKRLKKNLEASIK